MATVSREVSEGPTTQRDDGGVHFDRLNRHNPTLRTYQLTRCINNNQMTGKRPAEERESADRIVVWLESTPSVTGRRFQHKLLPPANEGPASCLSSHVNHQHHSERWGC